jgi:hypothetical protein
MIPRVPDGAMASGGLGANQGYSSLTTQWNPIENPQDDELSQGFATLALRRSMKRS